MSHRVSTTTTQLCPYSAKAVTDNPQMTECGCVPVKPYEYTQRVWPTGRGCAIPALKLKSDHVSLLLTTLRQPAIFPIAKDRAPEEPARGCSTCSRPCLSLSLLLTPLRPGDWPPPCSSSFSSSGRHRGLRPRSFSQEGASQDAWPTLFLSVCSAIASPGRFFRTCLVHRQAPPPLLAALHAPTFCSSTALIDSHITCLFISLLSFSTHKNGS